MLPVLQKFFVQLFLLVDWTRNLLLRILAILPVLIRNGSKRLAPAAADSQSRARIETDGLHRAICDYLAGMTDRYVTLEHERLDL